MRRKGRRRGGTPLVPIDLLLLLLLPMSREEEEEATTTTTTFRVPCRSESIAACASKAGRVQFVGMWRLYRFFGVVQVAALIASA